MQKGTQVAHKHKSKNEIRLRMPIMCLLWLQPFQTFILLLDEETEWATIGITNNINRRLREHRKNGWELIEYVGPRDGTLIHETESIMRYWLPKEIGCIGKTYENWYTKDLKVYSLKELKRLSNIKTNLFWIGPTLLLHVKREKSRQSRRFHVCRMPDRQYPAECLMTYPLQT